jgi:threonine dehydratase/serine racemase
MEEAGPQDTDLASVRAAATRIEDIVHRTPVATSRSLDLRSGRRLHFKCENLQRGGTFKIRGAYHALARLAPDVAARGVVSHSSGNHAQALALAARVVGVPAHVVVPENANPVKRRAAEEYGARIVTCAPTLAAREETAEEVLRVTGGTLIPPYDHPDVIAGQGTVGVELLEQVEGLDAIVAPVGGGGLVAGVAVAATETDPRVRVFAAEPRGADDAARSKAAGRRLPQESPDTIADGLLTSLGERTWPILRDRVEAVLTVPDEAIVEAMRLFWERTKLLIEPSAAVAVAAVLSEEFRALDDIERVGVILSGGNVNLDALPW